MNVRTTRYKTVSATSPQALDEALEGARTEIITRNENAQFVDFQLATSQGVIFATIVWSG